MTPPLFEVDFNELIEPDLVLLSRTDEKVESTGAIVTLREGLKVWITESDHDDQGRRDDLIARGTAVPNTTSYGRHAKWCCRIDSRGIRPSPTYEARRHGVA